MGILSPHLIEQLRELAYAAGFDLFGVAPADPFDQERERFQAWLAKGHAAGMQYLHNNLERRLDPQKVLPAAKSILCLGISYYHDSHTNSGNSGDTRRNPNSPTGRIARYAWGKDYHKVLAKKLKDLKQQIVALAGPGTELKEYTDTGPLMERQAAVRAGLGFIGKNTLMLNPKHGSYFFLSEILTNLDLSSAHGKPVQVSCGSCTACLDACPTQAFPQPYQMDASKCIAYWTIEHRGDIPEHFHKPIGDMVFGCDICQQACPFNRHPLPSRCEEFGPSHGAGATLDLHKTAAMDEAGFHAAYRHTPLTRAKYSGIMRNIKIVLKNTCSPTSSKIA